MSLRPMTWENDHLSMLDQRVLPHQEVWLRIETLEEVYRAIKEMSVRGAPAIGIAAAYGMALGAREGIDRTLASARLAASRPTAVNLFWALDRICAMPAWSFDAVLEEAHTIAREDVAMNEAIGRHGAELVPQNAQILTICNTGALATGGHGTALGVIRTAHADGKDVHIWSCETRPRQQGLRLTAYELMRDGIPFHSIADGAAAYLMATRKIDLVIVGADRIAANGDTANKIGTYMLACLAEKHRVPFVVAAPSSTQDPSLPDGSAIPIEERDGEELTRIEGVPVGPDGCPVWNPAFDVTPGSMIAAIVTELGVFRAPYQL